MDVLLSLLLLIIIVLIGGAVTWLVLAIVASIIGFATIPYRVCCVIYLLLKIVL